ncbi:hypothetical protein TNCV_1189411 [Trichonephila clavipes]|nr:hypothetical protein TNCV_1189411 [Trichonephila clavipes]
MLFGRDLRLPCDLLFGRPPDTPSFEEYVQNLQARFEDVHNLARERINLRTGEDEDSVRHKSHRRSIQGSYQVGDGFGDLIFGAKCGDMSPNVGDKLGDHGNPALITLSGNPIAVL